LLIEEEVEISWAYCEGLRQVYRLDNYLKLANKGRV